MSAHDIIILREHLTAQSKEYIRKFRLLGNASWCRQTPISARVEMFVGMSVASLNALIIWNNYKM